MSGRIVRELVGGAAFLAVAVPRVHRAPAHAFESHVLVRQHSVASAADVLLDDLVAAGAPSSSDIPHFHGTDLLLAIGTFPCHLRAFVVESHAAFALADTAVLELSEADIAGVVDPVPVQKLGRFLLHEAAIGAQPVFITPLLQYDCSITYQANDDDEEQCQGIGYR